jgi:hypothetical protein
MRRLWILITSLPSMAFLFVVFAMAMAIATFIETAYGTPAALVLVYKAWWFELILILLSVNLIANIIRFRQYRLKSLTMFIFHISFLVILVGAGITRYISYEGTMHIREGRTSGHILSADNYFYASSPDDEMERRVEFSEISPRRLRGTLDAGDSRISVKSVAYIANASRTPVASESGEPVVDFVVSGAMTQGMQSIYMQRGDHFSLHGFSAGFETGQPVSVKLFMIGNELNMTASDTVSKMIMGSDEVDVIAPGDTVQVERMFIYNMGGYRFILRNFFEKAIFTAAKETQGRTGENAVILKLSEGGRERVIPVFGHPGSPADTVTVDWYGTPVRLAYGAREIPLPFALHLREFQLERYPGSESPSSYASEVTLVDDENDVRRDLRIFMNSTLTYRGINSSSRHMIRMKWGQFCR